METKYLILAAMAILLVTSAGAATNNTLTSNTVASNTVTTTVSNTVNKTTVASNSSWAFQNGKVVQYVYYSNYTCSPGITGVYLNISQVYNASKVTQCETGSSAGVNVTGAIPKWNLVPAFAGTSVWGWTQFGSSSNGYPMWNGTVIMTQAPAGIVAMQPKYFYSPLTAMNEQSVNQSSGINGLPVGVLPSAAHDVLISPLKSNAITRSYRITVAVYDPNIFPNPTTGKCTQVAPSSLPNATSNCLTSVAALQAAIATTDNSVATINKGNPLWVNAGNLTTQAAILQITMQKRGIVVESIVNASNNVNVSNSNFESYSFVNQSATAPTTTINSTTVNTTTVAPTTSAATTNQSGTTGSGSSGSSLLIPAIIVIVIIIIVAWFLMKKK